MPFNSIPEKDFFGRKSELDYLLSLALRRSRNLPANVLLEGARGMGKSELLKQFHHRLFWEGDRVPFYYSFRSANLKGAYFARDYFSRFARQYISFLAKDASPTDSPAAPLDSLYPLMASLGASWLPDIIEDFQNLVAARDLYAQIVSAITLPSIAAKKGDKQVVLLLDDFDAAGGLYESNRGDAEGLVSLFGESFDSSMCQHIITGASATLKVIFSDHALLKGMEKMRLGPLSEDAASELFKSHLTALGVSLESGQKFTPLNILGGNPLYIRNLAKSAWKSQKSCLSDRDLIECYASDIFDGDTSFYWSSIFNRSIAKKSEQRHFIKILMHWIEQDNGSTNNRLSRVLGLREQGLAAAFDELQATGLMSEKSNVLRDYISCRYLIEIEGRKPEQAKDIVRSRYTASISSINDKTALCYELSLPMSENAELIAARTAEQILGDMGLEPELVQFLQLALIEVCINAMEHSCGQDKRMFVRFCAGKSEIRMEVESPGKPFTLAALKDADAGEKLKSGSRRGWGLKLVTGIMDDLRVERINDRTRVIITKNINQSEVST